MARRRRRSGIPVGFYAGLIVLLAVIWIVSLALAYWYVTVAALGAFVGGLYWRRERRHRHAERVRRASEEERAASRRAWRELTWSEGPYAVVVTGFVAPAAAQDVVVLLSDIPSLRESVEPEQAAYEVVERITHIAPQVVAQNISQYDAIQLKEALATRGAKVKIEETVRAVSGDSRRQAISAAVRREVWRRDEGRCVDCGSRERLEYDHIIAVANGGSNTARNIELRCETCNRRKGAKV